MNPSPQINENKVSSQEILNLELKWGTDILVIAYNLFCDVIASHIAIFIWACDIWKTKLITRHELGIVNLHSLLEIIDLLKRREGFFFTVSNRNYFLNNTLCKALRSSMVVISKILKSQNIILFSKDNCSYYILHIYIGMHCYRIENAWNFGQLGLTLKAYSLLETTGTV